MGGGSPLEAPRCSSDRQGFRWFGRSEAVHETSTNIWASDDPITARRAIYQLTAVPYFASSRNDTKLLGLPFTGCTSSSGIFAPRLRSPMPCDSTMNMYISSVVPLNILQLILYRHLKPSHLHYPSELTESYHTGVRKLFKENEHYAYRSTNWTCSCSKPC
jgi:hypothetical protein